MQVILAPARGADNTTSIVRPRGRTLDATIVGADEETDLAVLKVDATGLPALPFGDSDALRAGQVVCAFGSPLGLENSMTMGVVSAVGRQLSADDPMIYVQTDAPINPGNSGGALVDVQGRLVGINALILSQGGGNEGLGFAAPSNIVRTVFEQIRKWGRVKRGTIGVSAQTITPTLAEALRLPRDSGVILADVFPEEPGAAAGLKVGDIVLTLNGKPMENGRQFDVNLYRLAAGDIAVLELLRGSSPVKVEVAIGERQGDPTRFSDLVTPERHMVARLGILALDVNASLAASLGGLRGIGGVLVAARALNAGAEYGLAVGDMIFSVNGAPVKNLADLREHDRTDARQRRRRPAGAARGAADLPVVRDRVKDTTKARRTGRFVVLRLPRSTRSWRSSAPGPRRRRCRSSPRRHRPAALARTRARYPG